jgi:hypothetical protein
MPSKPAFPFRMDASVHLADSSQTSLGGLPPPETKRWVIRRKAAVVAAVRSGVISLEQACERYRLSSEEYLTWQRLVDSHGLPGLRVTRLHDYRDGGSNR